MPRQRGIYQRAANCGRLLLGHKKIVLSRLPCRPLTSRFEGWPDCEGPEQREEDDAQNDLQPGENEAKVVTDGAEDDVGGIAGATFEIAAAEMAFCLHVSDHRLDGGATSELAFDAAEDPALLA
jgi:hypothetical protein